jgi:membrane associated rhomboid family serine protease
MLLPIGDDDRRLRGTPYVTGALVLGMFLSFALLQDYGANADAVGSFAAVPYELTTGEDLVGPVESTLAGETVVIDHRPGLGVLTVLTALMLHSGIVHLGGNALFLWIFGNNVELRLGRPAFAALFVAAGATSIGCHVLADPTSTLPLIGASGAISGVIGSYAALFPKNRVYVLFLYRVISVPAVVAVGLWAGIQAASAVGLWLVSEPGTSASKVAFVAHLGGLLFGVIAGLAWKAYEEGQKGRRAGADVLA